MAQITDCSTGCSAICDKKCCRCKNLSNPAEVLSPPYLMLTAFKYTETAKQEHKREQMIEREQMIKSQSLQKE